MDQDKKPDPITEERFFPEGVQRDISEKDIPEKDAPVRHKAGRKGGRKLFLWGMALLLLGFAFPLLLVFLIKWPHPGQHLLIFGISYYKLLFIYFLTSALLIHTSFFLLRARPLVVMVFFVLSLFCCFPFILGLRSNLTLYQTIVGIPIFYNWPFFLNPSYVMIEFLLPAGVLIYLSLQIKNIFSNNVRSYAFLYVAVYLSIAALLGLFGLNEAKQPNIATALAGITDYSANRPLTLRTDQNILRKPVLEKDGAIEFQSPMKYAVPPSGKQSADPQKNGGNLVSVSREVRQLVEKVGALEAQIKEMRTLLPEKEAAPQEEKPAPEKENTAANEISEEQSAIMELEGRIHLLSEEVRIISDTVKSMAPTLPKMVEEPDKKAGPAEETTVEEKDSDIEQMSPY